MLAKRAGAADEVRLDSESGESEGGVGRVASLLDGLGDVGVVAAALGRKSADLGFQGGRIGDAEDMVEEEVGQEDDVEAGEGLGCEARKPFLQCTR